MRRPDADVAALNDAIAALRQHPRFLDAIKHLLNGAAMLYQGNPLLHKVINDRGRFVGGMIVLYLHFSSAVDEPGFAVSRFQAFCVEHGLCSFGRARALLTMMGLSGYLMVRPGALDRRERRLLPTQRLIDLQRRRLGYQFEALALMLPADSRLVLAYPLPTFTPALFRALGDRFVAGFRLLDYTPELSQVMESNGGLLLILHLFLLAADDMTPRGVAVPISVSALSARFHVARAHVRSLLASAASAGLVNRAGDAASVVVLPRLDTAVRTFCAALFGLLLHCANRAAETIADSPQSDAAAGVTVSSMI